MHHPCISRIILTIDDYFILIDGNDSQCLIEPTVDTYDNGALKLGVKIVRKLLNGYIHIFIVGEGRDDDEVTLSYCLEMNTNNYLKSIKIENSNYSADKVRDAVRILLKLDKTQNNQQLST